MTTPPEPRRWTDLSWDPNAGPVIAWQEAALAAARHEEVDSRVGYLCTLAEGRHVLDVGVVEHGPDSRRNSAWLHGHIVRAADRCLGVDVLEAEIEALRSEGFEVATHDLTTSPLRDSEGRVATFDLIVLGEVIEHLGAPERLLASAAQMLAPDGRVVITTPNPYMLHRTLKHLRGEFPDSADHVSLLTAAQIAELARRVGLRLDSWRGVRLKDLPGTRNRVASAGRRLACLALGDRLPACDTVIYELVAGS